MKFRPTRIIKHTTDSGFQYFTVEIKKWLFFWREVWETNPETLTEFVRTYPTMQSAKQDLCYYNGSKKRKRKPKPKKEIVYESEVEG